MRELLREALNGRGKHPLTFRGFVTMAASSVFVLWCAWVSTDLLSMQKSWAAHGEPTMAEQRRQGIERQRAIDSLVTIQGNMLSTMGRVERATLLNGRKIVDMGMYHFGGDKNHECILND